MSSERELSDVELCGLLHSDAETNYQRALDVMTAYPDYALTQFRIVAEFLVHDLVARFRLELKHGSLCILINELYSNQIIDRSLCSDFHKIRTLGNEAVHSRSLNPAKSINDPPQENIRTVGDLDTVVDSRKILVNIFEKVYLLLYKGLALPKITLTAVDDHTSKQTLWKAVTSLDFASKFAAGLILEANSMVCADKDALIAQRAEVAHQIANERMAAEMYWAACVISAGLDRFSVVEITRKGGEEACLFKRADIEALYRYGLLTYHQGKDEERQRLGILAIQEAARRGHVSACAHYGDFLRRKGCHNEALKLLQKAAAQEDITAFFGLYLLYREEGSVHFSMDKAVQSLQDGIDNNSHRCEYELGRIIYYGKHVGADKERGVELIKAAAAGGLWDAKAFLEFSLEDKLAKNIQAQLLASLDLIMTVPPMPKLGRNDRCPCGSGKKFKNCCRDGTGPQ